MRVGLPGVVSWATVALISVSCVTPALVIDVSLGSGFRMENLALKSAGQGGCATTRAGNAVAFVGQGRASGGSGQGRHGQLAAVVELTRVVELDRLTPARQIAARLLLGRRERRNQAIFGDWSGPRVSRWSPRRRHGGGGGKPMNARRPL